MISGWTRNTPTPMPFTKPITSAGSSAIAIATAGALSTDCVATMKPAIVATVPTERSMPPVSMTIVWQPASSASGIANFTVLAIQRWLTMPGLENLEHDHQQDQQDDQRHERIVAHEALDAAAERHGLRGCCADRS